MLLPYLGYNLVFLSALYVATSVQTILYESCHSIIPKNIQARFIIITDFFFLLKRQKLRLNNFSKDTDYSGGFGI